MSDESPLWRFPSAMMGWRNMGRNRMRTALAALGIVIGVIAIASLGIAGTALEQQASSDLGGLANEVSVSAGEDNSNAGLTESQVREIRGVTTSATVVAEKSNQTTLSANGEETRVSVTGVTRASALYDAETGDVPDRLNSGALVSSDVANQLGLELGDPVEYDGQLYRIQGITASEGFGPGGGGNEIVLPLSALSDQEYYSSLTVVAEDGDAAQEAASAIEAELNDGDEETVTTRTAADTQENVDSFMSTLNLALLGIGSISLIVASVAILNVMLMSTVERRGEIGVLRAVGIRRGEVLRMILTEAGLLGLLGGIVGAVASLAVGLAIFQALVGDPTLVFQWDSVRYVVYGLVFAVVASLLSGVYPAWKAANEHPIDSLRG